MNSMTYNCFSTCDPSSPSNNVVIEQTDSDTTDFLNDCCYTPLTSVGYGTGTTICTKCKLYYIYYNYSSHI